jgi:uracil-DNA glycosylase
MNEQKIQRLKDRLGEGWYEMLKDEFDKDYMNVLGSWLAAERKNVYVYPSSDDMFNAFKAVQPANVKVIILGQDPYHTPGIAHGLAFSSKEPLYLPPSLEIIFREIESDLYGGLNLGLYEHTELTRWTKQGIFLLNTILTVEKDQALSHENKGWESFTGRVIVKNHNLKQPIVWMLWGKKAQVAYDKVVKGTNPDHLVLRAPHPAAEAYRPGAGFIGCGHFSKANEFLKGSGLTEIEW